jgi:hypothetical protein
MSDIKKVLLISERQLFLIVIFQKIIFYDMQSVSSMVFWYFLYINMKLKKPNQFGF